AEEPEGTLDPSPTAAPLADPDAPSAPALPGTDGALEEQDEAATHDEAPPDPPPAIGTPSADAPDDEHDTAPAWESSWRPTWQPTGSSAVAETLAAASPVATGADGHTEAEDAVTEDAATESRSEIPSTTPDAATQDAATQDTGEPVADEPVGTLAASLVAPVVPTTPMQQAVDAPIPPPEATAEAAQRAATTAEGEEVPAFVEYRPSDVRRYVLGTLFVIASLLAVLAIFYAVQEGGTSPAITAAAVVVLAGALWWGLLSWAPTIVSISRGILEVSQGPTSERFDLRDPGTEVVVGDDPRSRSWTTTVGRPHGKPLVIKATQVRPQQFSRIVRHYRDLGDS
ncbi:MAG: hypothetical protein ACTHJH_09630, partial [Marmoricola sp.]